MSIKARFTVIYASGRAAVYENETYFNILTKIYDGIRSGGSNHDLATMLLRNGAVVVAAGLHNLAWDYGWGMDKSVSEARRSVQAQHTPEWLSE